MAATDGTQPAAFETDVDEFEDVALLLEPDKGRSHASKKRSWKDQFLRLVAGGGRGDLKGFTKLDNIEEDSQDAGRQQGAAGFDALV